MTKIYRNEAFARREAQATADMYRSATLYANDAGNYTIAAEGEVSDRSHGEYPVALFERGLAVPARVIFSVTIA